MVLPDHFGRSEIGTNAVAACATLPPAIIEIGAIRLNVESKTVEVNGQRVYLTSREYQLL